MYVNVTKAVANNASSTLEDLDRRMADHVHQLHRLAVERAEVMLHDSISQAFSPRPALILHPPE